jgi:hypothetical protein
MHSYLGPNVSVGAACQHTFYPGFFASMRAFVCNKSVWQPPHEMVLYAASPGSLLLLSLLLILVSRLWTVVVWIANFGDQFLENKF